MKKTKKTECGGHYFMRTPDYKYLVCADCGYKIKFPSAKTIGWVDVSDLPARCLR